MPEKEREAGRWISRHDGYRRMRAPRELAAVASQARGLRSLTARATAAQFLGSPSDMRVPPRSTSSAEASRS